jgi:hypothetical protein
MSLNRSKFLAGAIALAIGGTAMANTNLDGTSVGDVFINIVDTTNNTSFVYDTGVSQATFNGGASSTPINLNADANYTAFVAAEGSGDSIDYSVFSATKPTSASEIVYFTSSIPVPTTQTSTNMAAAASTLGSFLVGANSIVTTSTKSANLTGTLEFGTALTEGAIAGYLTNNSNVNAAGGYADDAALGTALGFYEDAASRSGVTTNAVAFAGSWNIVGGVATYTVASAVPLPTPMLLLLSGLGLMGVVARRNKTA